MQLAKGTRLGPYEIVGPLGSGGMGEVYHAQDTRLGRAVAIKLLPVNLSDDPKLRLRFQREAKAIAKLSHPNICALYDIGEAAREARDGAHQGSTFQYLVMEYLEGETLEERLRKRPLPLDQAIRYGLEIGDALDKAHRKRILHRDLKPSNIMVTKSGARLFDFGLAKFLHPESSGRLQAGRDSSEELHSRFFSQATTPEKPLTAEGAVMGTLEYMAPEQLAGKEPDTRTDIFSYGVCLYQMITGRRPFQGSSRATLVAAILDFQPAPVSTFQPSSPPSLDWLVANCLAKDPDERIQTAHDIVLELKRISDELRVSTPAVGASRMSRVRTSIIYLAAIVAIIIAADAALMLLQTRRRLPDVTQVKRFSIALPSNAPIAAGRFEKFAVSPDGSRIAYVGGGVPSKLYLYSIDKAESAPLPETDGARGPFFSPDGKWLGFYTANRDLKKIAIEKGAPVLLAAGRNLRGATWGLDDSIIFGEPLSPLRRISTSGGRAEALTEYGAESEIRWPSLLPGGEWILYTESDFGSDYENAKLAVSSLKSGETRIVLNGATYGRYVAPGFLVYFHSESLYAVPFDLAAKRVTGPPIPVITDVDSYFGQGLAHFAVSSDGSLFYIPRDLGQSEHELVWVDRSGSLSAVTSLRRGYEEPKLSPDGTRLLVTIGPRPRSDLWVYDIGRGTWSRLTTEATNVTGVWSPDGRQIAFSSNRNGGFDLYVMPSDGSAPPKQITARRSWDFPGSWSPDGKVITVLEQYRARLGDIFVVAPQERSTPVALVSTQFDESEAVFSPDGRWFAYQSNQSGRDEIYVQNYPTTGRKWLVSAGGGTSPGWRRDGEELFYRNGDRMMSVAIRMGENFAAGKPRMLFKGDFENDYDVTADGQRFLMVRHPPQAPRTQINVVLGAFDHLK